MVVELPEPVALLEELAFAVPPAPPVAVFVLVFEELPELFTPEALVEFDWLLLEEFDEEFEDAV